MDDSASIPTSSGIYRITCTANQKIYIGSALNLRKRRADHFNGLRRNDHRNAKLQHAWNKYGKDTFVFDILELVLIPEMLTAREQHWFDKLKPFGKNGFNIAATAGSCMGIKASPETREKLRKSHLGKPSARKGITLSAETRAKIKIARARQANPRIGRKHSAESIAKMRASRIGQPNGCLGTKRSAESKEKMRIAATGNNSHAKTYIVTDPNGNEYVVHGLARFCRDHGLDANLLGQVAKGNRPHHKRWTARYPELGAS